MKYDDGTAVKLGDICKVRVPGGTAEARVVMLGETYEHLDIDEEFLSWVKAERVLEPSHVVLQWCGENPLAHTDQRYAPVGDYMFSPLDEDVMLPAKRTGR